MKKKFILVAVAAIALTAAPLAFAGAASSQHAAVKLSGGQSVTVTCSGKSLTVAESSKKVKLTCVPDSAETTRHNGTGPKVYGDSAPGDSATRSRPDAAAEERC